MTLSLLLLAGALYVAAALTWWANRRGRRQSTWVCTVCRAGFSTRRDAEAHMAITHR